LRYGELLAILACAVVLLAAWCGASAQIPQKINYQVMLTNDADIPLADQTVQMTFTLYDAETDGTALWSETQSPTTNSIGVVSVILGSVNPIDCQFDGPMWLEIEVESEVLSPRRELVTSPFAARAAEADNSQKLGDIEAAEYALLDDIGSLGDGHSLDADDGSPVDALYVDSDGHVRVGHKGDGLSLYVGGTDVYDASVGLQDGIYGGVITVRDEAGLIQGYLKADVSPGGGGSLWLARDTEGDGGLYLDGNAGGTREPALYVSGSTRSARLDMRFEGTDSVLLPSDSIDKSETRDEPGVGSIQAGGELDINPGNVTTVASRTVICPTSGYVFVIGTGELTMYLYDNAGVEVKSGISTSVNAWSGAAQENTIDLPGVLPGGWYHMQACAQGLFAVDAGTNTFHMNIQEISGDVRVSARQLSVMFFPTAYGGVDTTD
jgi:hypothetical protein